MVPASLQQFVAVSPTPFLPLPFLISFTEYLIELAREIVVLGPPLFGRENMDASDLLLAKVPRDILSGDQDG